MTDYASILRNLGYKLTDRGNYWQTSALFRDGNNNTAISVYKDSGVWTDFVAGNRPLPFEILLKKTLKTNDVSHILKNNDLNFTIKRRELLREEKTFKKDSLNKLLPDFDFFKNRGISEKTQKEYKCGLATNGKFYRRIVFPILREDGLIHGFSGRKVIQDNDSPKWLHYGKTANWLYPYFSVEGVKEQTQEEGRVFLVESIGDSMSLYQSGVKNNCVTFTNKANVHLLSKLNAMNKDVVLSLNNDGDQNRGFDGALASLLEMIDNFDLERIWFFPCPIVGKDFGDMTSNEVKDWRESLVFDRDSHRDSICRLIDYAPKAKLAKKLIPKIKKLKNEFAFLYE